MVLKGRKIGIIGGGKMGEVLLSGIISHKLASAKDIVVSDTVAQRLEELKKTYRVQVTSDNNKTVRHGGIIILAVKPQNMAEVLEGIAGAVSGEKIIISIAAGITTKFIETRLGKNARVIRVMPNTPALVGEGVAALAAGAKATAQNINVAGQIFDSVGITVVVKEALMDAVTGLSGSGPAYAFVIIEALADAGVRMGLGRDIALTLSAQTMLGAARLCIESGKHPAELKDMVTSPGGTTIAGLKALEDGKIRATLMAAVEAATLRSKELGSAK